MFLDMGVCEKDNSGDILQGVLKKGGTGGRNCGFLNIHS